MGRSPVGKFNHAYGEGLAVCLWREFLLKDVISFLPKAYESFADRNSRCLPWPVRVNFFLELKSITTKVVGTMSICRSISVWQSAPRFNR